MPVAGNGPSDPLLTLLDALPDGVIVTEAGAPHHVLWVSDAYLALTGMSVEDMLGRELEELCSHEGSSTAFARLLAALAHGETADARMRVRGRDNRLITLDVRVVQLSHEEVDPARVAWIARVALDRSVARIDEAIYSYVLNVEGEAELVYTSPRFEALIDTTSASRAPFDSWRARIHPG